jgi:glycosyltransferase involved in cell wall biosynthesis
MHIVIPIHDFSAGGTEVIAFRLAAAWRAAGHQVSVLAGDLAGTMRARLPDDIASVVINPPVARSTLSRLRLGEAMVPDLVALKPDLVFLPGAFHFILAHAFKRALPRVPIVAKLSNPLIPPPFAARIAGFAGRAVLRRYLAPIDMISAMSHGLEADLRSQAPGQDVCTIFDPNVPNAVFPAAMRDRRENIGEIALLAVARLEPQKHLELAIDALALLRTVRLAQLTILGEGTLRSKLEQHAARRGVSKSVAMPGFADTIAGPLSTADILLVSSRYEGGPATAVEALAAGVPVVSTDCSLFLRDLIASPRLGRLTQQKPEALAEAVLAQMQEEPASAQELSAAIAPCRYGRSANEYLDLFERLVAQSRSA